MYLRFTAQHIPSPLITCNSLLSKYLRYLENTFTAYFAAFLIIKNEQKNCLALFLNSDTRWEKLEIFSTLEYLGLKYVLIFFKENLQRHVQ